MKILCETLNRIFSGKKCNLWINWIYIYSCSSQFNVWTSLGLENKL